MGVQEERMKEITIVWLNKKEARLITVTPSDIVQNEHVTASDNPSAASASPPVRNVKKDFYDNVVSKLQESREIVLFGPDNTKEELLDYLETSARHLFGKVIGVESSQDIPEEKIIARGRKYI
jgi:stalled ribosome rescue protein Dom34